MSLSTFSARGVNCRIRRSLPSITTGRLTLLYRLFRSLLMRFNSALRVCNSSLTVVNSSFVDCNSSLAVSSSSLVLCNSSLLDRISSFADLSSSFVASCSSMMDCKYSFVALKSCFNCTSSRSPARDWADAGFLAPAADDFGGCSLNSTR